jgi:acyl-CoA synthetase (NDP forming)/RimJ/RimL family protein N-acetyltransferase
MRISTDDPPSGEVDTALDAAFCCLIRRAEVMPGFAIDPQPLVRDVLLRDGATLRLQTPTPGDFGDIKAFYEGLSPESRYLRFHGSGRTDIVARAEAEASGVDRLALIGRHGGRVVASASYDGLREKGVAEVAFAVADDLQGHGIGMRMLEQLAAIAAERGIHRFDAEVIAANQPMLDMFEHAGFVVRRRGSFGEVTVSLDITPTEAVRERIGERDHIGAVAALRPILAPSSIAVVGAAAAPGNVGQAVLANIIAGGFQGVVSPVNREGGVVCSMSAAGSLHELPVAPELVIIAAAGDDLLESAAEATAIGAKALLVLWAGPADAGGVSPGQEQRLLEIVRAAGLRMVGPGSLGVLNTAPEVSVNATFRGVRVQPGGLAIGSHAVGLGLGLLGHAAARLMGISVFVSLGNRTDVSTSDLLEWCEDDERTAAVMLYVESFGDPQRFTRVAQRVAREKPILLVKGGSGGNARLHARSQTAAALRGDAAFDALLHQAGVMRFRSGEELFQAAELFESQPLPRGGEVGIVSNSRSVAMLAADACVTRGLHVSTASDAQNPMLLPLGAGPGEYAAGIRELIGDPGVDALVVSYVDRHGGDPEAVLAAISAASMAVAKPVVTSVVRSDGRLPARTRSDVPNFLFPESCAAALARAAQRHAWLSRPLGERPAYPDLRRSAARELIASSLEERPSGGWLSLGEAEALLACQGIPFAASRDCRDVDEAVAAALDIGGPVALKARFAAPVQASQIHVPLLGLEGESAIRSGWRELKRGVQAAGRRWNGAIVQRLAEPGADVLVGTVRDSELGSVIGVGLGGRQAAFDRSTAFRLPPSTDIEADELIDACEGLADQLDDAALNREALRELILRFALLLEELPELVEGDLNSIRTTTTRCVVLDMRMRIERHSPVERIKTW